MNSKIGNIVVKEIGDNKLDYSSLAKPHQKQIKRLGAKRKHLRNTKKNTFFHKYERIEKKKK
jgi:hypothetical protein